MSDLRTGARLANEIASLPVVLLKGSLSKTARRSASVKGTNSRRVEEQARWCRRVASALPRSSLQNWLVRCLHNMFLATVMEGKDESRPGYHSLGLRCNNLKATQSPHAARRCSATS